MRDTTASILSHSVKPTTVIWADFLSLIFKGTDQSLCALLESWQSYSLSVSRKYGANLPGKFFSDVNRGFPGLAELQSAFRKTKDLDFKVAREEAHTLSSPVNCFPICCPC